MNPKALIVAGLFALAAGESRATDREFEQKIAAQPNGSVEISNVAGSLDIVGWERPQVQVQGELGDGVDRVDVSGGGARIYVKVILKKNSRDGDASLTISVPRGSEVSASSVSADVATRGIAGRQRLSTVSGEIDAEVAAADAQMKSVSGDIRLRGSQQSTALRLSTVSGNLTVERGAGDVDASSISGDVSLEVDPARNVRLHTTSGELDFRGQLIKDANLDVETVSGGIALHARGKAGYEYEVSSFAGDIRNCFGKKAERMEAYGPGSRLNGTLGEGGARVSIKAMSGDVDLCDK